MRTIFAASFALCAGAVPLAGQTSVPCAAPVGPAPGSITATAAPPNVVVGWTKVTGAVGYGVVRKNPDNTCWNLTPQGTTALTVQEPSPTAAGTYGYQVAVRLSTGQYGLSQWVAYTVTPPPQILTPPPTGTPTIMSDALPPVGLTVTGTPTTATVTWGAPSAAVEYRVNRAPAGTTSWTAVTPTPITTTTVNDVLPNPAQPYTYSVLAYRKDGHFGEASVNFTAPPPTNPKGLAGSAAGNTVTLSWQPVQYAARYRVTGPGVPSNTATTNTTFTVSSAPAGNNVYKVGSVFEPGALQTPTSAWSTVTVAVVAAPATCACTKTGPFTAPVFTQFVKPGLTGYFNSPAGRFEIKTQSVSGKVMLDVYDPRGASVLSVTDPAGWGLGPNGEYFVVSIRSASTNTAANVSVYRVRSAPPKWSPLLDVQAMADGTWGFSSEASQFIVMRWQNTRFSAQAYNLRANNPRNAVQQFDETGVNNPVLTTSPCGDRLLYFRWHQLSPLAGQGDFHARSSFGMNQPVTTNWDGLAQVTPTAAAVAGSAPNVFLVQLNGLKTPTGQTTTPSLQCSP